MPIEVSLGRLGSKLTKVDLSSMDGESLLSCGRYIERNPLEAGLVREPWEYRWSSCPAYALVNDDSLLAENAYHLELGKRPTTR